MRYFVSYVKMLYTVNYFGNTVIDYPSITSEEHVRKVETLIDSKGVVNLISFQIIQGDLPDPTEIYSDTSI